MGDAAPATLARVIGRFCHAFAELQAALDRAVAARDRDAVAALGHAGKGAAATAAASALTAEMVRLMALAPTGAWAEIEACAGRSAAELDRVRRFVETAPGASPDRG
jgi:HPt (histidine-containing phosphotransfer) domain-containing protein